MQARATSFMEGAIILALEILVAGVCMVNSVCCALYRQHS